MDRLDYDSTIQVRVDADERSFVIHTDVACNKSKFFRAACSTRWREGQEKVIRLPEVKSETFQRYVDWAYRDALAAEPTAGEGLDMSVELYLLGDLLDDVKLRNATVKALLRHMKEDRLCPGPLLMGRIFERTAPTSLLRTLIVDITIMTVNRRKIEESIVNWPVDLVRQLALKSMQRLPRVHSRKVLEQSSEYLEAEEGD